MSKVKTNDQAVEVVIDPIDAVLETLPTKSAKIRFLLSEYKGNRGKVAKKLNIRYQHVRNVEITPIKTPKA